MANLTTTGDIKAAVLQHAGELTNGKSAFDRLVLTYINRVYMEILGGGSTFTPEIAEPWSWAKAQQPGVLTLQPAYLDGTISLVNGSMNGVFSSPPPTTLGSFVNRVIKVGNLSEYYRVKQHAPGGADFVLDFECLGPTGAQNYRAHKLEYNIGASSGIMRLIEPMRVYKTQVYSSDQQGKVYGMGTDKLTETFPLRTLIQGVPTHFAVVGEANGVMRVQFNASVGETTRVEYDYIPIPEELSYSSTPLLPREDRMVLVYGATYWLMIDKEDSRSETYFRLCQQKLQAMALARRKEFGRINRDYARMNPRQDGTSLPSRVWSQSGLRF